VFENIKKRDGRLVRVDSSKVTAPIAKAGKSTGEFGQTNAADRDLGSAQNCPSVKTVDPSRIEREVSQEMKI
jgi:hypothetical protein